MHLILFPIIRSKLIIIRLDLDGELFNFSSHISLKPWTDIAGLRLLYDIMIYITDTLLCYFNNLFSYFNV